MDKADSTPLLAAYRPAPLLLLDPFELLCNEKSPTTTSGGDPAAPPLVAPFWLLPFWLPLPSDPDTIWSVEAA